MDNFIRFLYTNKSIHRQTVITVLIQMSKNERNILPRKEKTLNIYIFVSISQIQLLQTKYERTFSSISDATFLTQISLSETKEVSQETFYGLPENLPVKRCTQFKVTTSVRPEGIKGQTRRQVYRQEVGFSAAFFPPILVINFQVVQRCPVELRNDVIDGAREQEGWLLRVRSQPSAHTNVDLQWPILHVTTSDYGESIYAFLGKVIDSLVVVSISR